MCGVTPSSDGSLIPLYSVFVGLAILAVIFRIVARGLTQAYFWWDDFFNAWAFVGLPCPRAPSVTLLLIVRVERLAAPCSRA
jgi:hypothetical protein